MCNEIRELRICDFYLRQFFCVCAVLVLFASVSSAATTVFVHPRLIVVSDKKTAQEILDSLKQGTSFALLARQKSIDEKSRDHYGDLGQIPIEKLDPALWEVAARLNEGQVSGIVPVQGGHFALLQIVDLSFYRKGSRAFRAGDFRNAETDLLKHIELNPDAVKGRIMLARIYESQKNNKKAERLYAEALSCDPLSEEAYSRLGSLYMTDDRYTEAAALYKEGLKHLPDSRALQQGMKNVMVHVKPSGQSHDIGKVFLRIIVAGSKSDADNILAQIRKGKSFAALAKTRSIDEKSKEAFGYLGEVDTQTLDKPVREALSGLKPGETSGVLRLGEKRYVIVQRTDIHYFAEGEKAFISGELETARRDLLRHVALNPDSVRALTMLGMIYEGEKNFEKAEAMYRQAIFYDPSAVVVYERLGRIYLLTGHFEKAKALYQEGLTHVPSSQELSEGLEMTDILLINRGAGVP